MRVLEPLNYTTDRRTRLRSMRLSEFGSERTDRYKRANSLIRRGGRWRLKPQTEALDRGKNENPSKMHFSTGELAALDTSAYPFYA